MAIELLAGERKEGESERAAMACNDYLRMGAGRSLRKLLGQYLRQSSDNPPTDKWATLGTWSNKYDWQARAATYDVRVEREKTEAAAAARREVMESGLALDHERVGKLKRLAGFLEDFIYEERVTPEEVREELLSIVDDEGFVPMEAVVRLVAKRQVGRVGPPFPNVWLPDVKQIGGGEFAERVDIVRFNPALIERYQAVLDDIAKEKGERKQKVEHDGELVHRFPGFEEMLLKTYGDGGSKPGNSGA